MKLPKFFSRKPTDKRYLLLMVSDHSVRSGLVIINQGAISVTSQSETRGYNDKETFIMQADAALQDLSNESDNVDEVIFALEATWVNEAGIIDVKKPLLKEVTTKLSLKAVGFVVIPEALIQAHSSPDNDSFILAEVGVEKVSVYLINHENIEKAEVISRSQRNFQDIMDGITRLTQHTSAASFKPNKLVLATFELDESELTTMQQDAQAISWDSIPLFVTPPAIEIVSATQVTAIVGSKGGEAVARAHGMILAQNGEEAIDTSDAPRSFGVPITKDHVPAPAADELELETQEELSSLEQKKKRKLIAIITASIVAGIFVVLLIIYFIIRTTAEAVFVITPRLLPVSKEVEITVDSGISASDPEALILAGNTQTTTVETSETISTTGRKIVGDEAKGQITIFNKTTSEKTFEEGTIVKANNLIFELDEEVTVPAAEEQIENAQAGTTYGKANITVTAQEIGAEGNLAKDTKMSVSDFSTSTYEAVVTEGFKDGSSREVRIISEEDKNKVLIAVRAKLLEAGQKKLEEDVSEGLFILPTQTIEITSAQYSADVEDEADEVTVQAKADVTAVAYNAADIKPIAQKVLESDIPSGYALVDEDPQVLSAPGEAPTASGSAQQLVINITAQAKPTFNEAEIEAKVSGKSPTEALQILEKESTIQKIELQFRPVLASRMGVLIPKDPDKISILVQ